MMANENLGEHKNYIANAHEFQHKLQQCTAELPTCTTVEYIVYKKAVLIN